MKLAFVTDYDLKEPYNDSGDLNYSQKWHSNECKTNQQTDQPTSKQTGWKEWFIESLHMTKNRFVAIVIQGPNGDTNL